MFFTVSAQANSFGGLFNISRQKNVTVSGFDQNALINLITYRNNELMAGSQYPQTTRSLLKRETDFILHGHYPPGDILHHYPPFLKQGLFPPFLSPNFMNLDVFLQLVNSVKLLDYIQYLMRLYPIFDHFRQ